MTRSPSRRTIRALFIAAGAGAAVATTMLTAGAAVAIVVPPSPPVIVSVETTCSVDALPGTGTATIVVSNPSGFDDIPQSYAWTLAGPAGSSVGGIIIEDGATGTVSAAGLPVGVHSFEIVDAVSPDLADSTTFTVDACPPPPTTTTTTTTVPGPTTTTVPGPTTTTVPGPTTTGPGPTTTGGPPPTPTEPPVRPTDAPSTGVLPRTGGGPTPLVLAAASAVVTGAVTWLLSARRRA